jgi:hypothetical protein
LIFEYPIWSLLEHALKAFVSGNRVVRWLFAFVAMFATAGLIFVSLVWFFPSAQWLQIAAAACGSLAFIIVLGIGAYQRALAITKQEEVIVKVEERAREHPDQPQAAWDLARVKLESYLNRNLWQVQLIFLVTCTVMIAGFIIIGYGVIRVYQSPDALKPSIVVTTSGVLVEFIAATLLLIYRSTMEQARSYVSMLEKINAVGMSIQILDSIKGQNTDKARTQLAMELLTLYGMKKSVSKKELE